MSNGSPNIIQVIYKKIFGTGKSSALTNKKNEVILKLVKMHILEMEDVLFHLNSAVMMPENPQGKSSSQGGGAGEEQLAITGLKALAIVFKQFEFDPDNKIVITGHTDTSGGYDFNFKLSDERAMNILYLLIGNKEDWAKICYGRHKIEDYQQIMRYFEKKLACGCDPENINDKWDEKTKEATSNFFKKTVPDKADALLVRVENDSKKRWPVEAWYPVYDLYSKEIAEVLEISEVDLEILRIFSIKFIDDKKPYLGCGESFPIDSKEKNNYRSQKNRRVEILFFDQDEIPELNCPAVKNRAHKEEECPLWRKFYFIPLYIDPADLKAIVYHLQFVYYDVIKKKVMPIPDGLKIKAIGNDKKEIPSESVYKDGIYFLKVKFGGKIKDPARKEFYFQLETTDQWVYTENDKTDPVIKTMSKEDVEKLPLLQRICYYDLPAKWSSLNYWTRYDGDINKGGRFQKIFTEELKLKPFGDNITKKDKPMVFSFDDIVLLDTKGGTQNLKDWDHNRNPNQKVLSEKSRIKVFLVDDASGALKLYQKTNELKSARIPFLKETVGAATTWSNLFVEDPDKVKLAKVIFFRDGFYTLRNKRTVEENDWINKNFVIGARAAVRNDSDYHVAKEMYYNGSEFGSTGDYDIHYFHNQHILDKHPVSHVIIYVSISFMRDIRDPAVEGPIPTADDVKKYVDEGIYNAVDHWNRKQYYLEEDPKGDDKYIIRPFYFFDEREHFTITEPAGGFKIDFDKRPAEGANNHSLFFNHANLAAAQNNSIGGISKFIAFVCRDVNGHWGPAYQWSIRSEGPKYYSVFKLNKSGYTDFNDVFPGIPVTEHAESYGAFTFAHELGHSTGQPDEYIKKGFKPDPGQNYECYDFPQFYLPYSMPANTTSMMYSNAAPRLHHLYYLIHKLEECSKDANDPISKMIPNKKFTARLKKATMDHEYIRKIVNGNPNVNKNPQTALHSEQLFQVTANPLRRLSLELYDTGKDESSTKYFHKNQNITYQGVLVVRVLLSVRFTGTWTNADKAVKIFDIEQTFSSLGEHFRLVQGSKDFKNIYIHFLPGFSNTWGTAGSTYNLDFVKTNKPAASDQIPNSSGTLTIYNDTTVLQLIFYFMNSPGPVTKNHLTYLKTWVDGKLNDTFNLVEF